MCVSRKVYVAYAVSHGPAYVVFRQVMLACRCDSQWHRSVTLLHMDWEQHASRMNNIGRRPSVLL